MEIFPLFGFVEVKNVLIILHLLGVALGVGGALVSDLMFIKSVRNGTITRTEMSFLRLGSSVVWGGLLLLVVSGASMFFLNPEAYASSSKFLVKMTVVGILVLNAIAFHAVHIPRLSANVGKRLASSRDFTENTGILIVSGVISIVSWISALVLGSLSSIPYSYITVLSVYIGVLAVALVMGILGKDRFISKE